MLDAMNLFAFIRKATATDHSPNTEQHLSVYLINHNQTQQACQALDFPAYQNSVHVALIRAVLSTLKSLDGVFFFYPLNFIRMNISCKC